MIGGKIGYAPCKTLLLQQIPNGFSGRNVLALPSLFYATFLKNCGRDVSLGLPHVLKLWLGVSNGMLPVKYFNSNKASFCISQISLRSHGCHKDDVNLATLSFGDIARFKTVVSVSV